VCEALKLPAHERALLADALLGSLDDEAVRQAEAACAREAEDRFQAYVRDRSMGSGFVVWCDLETQSPNEMKELKQSIRSFGWNAPATASARAEVGSSRGQEVQSIMKMKPIQ